MQPPIPADDDKREPPLCANCHAPIYERAPFCPNCGATLSDATLSETRAPSLQIASPASPPVAAWRVVLSVLLGLLAAGTTFVLGAVMLGVTLWA